MIKCRKCNKGKLEVLGIGGPGDIVEVECQRCGEIYEVEMAGLDMEWEEWGATKMKEFDGELNEKE